MLLYLTFVDVAHRKGKGVAEPGPAIRSACLHGYGTDKATPLKEKLDWLGWSSFSSELDSDKLQLLVKLAEMVMTSSQCPVVAEYIIKWIPKQVISLR